MADAIRILCGGGEFWDKNSDQGGPSEKQIRGRGKDIVVTTRGRRNGDAKKGISSPLNLRS